MFLLSLCFVRSADALLISIGVAGISIFQNNYIDLKSDWLFGISAIWLALVMDC